MHKTFRKFRFLILTAALVAIAILPAMSGPIPATQLQYPYYVWTAPPGTNTGTTETNLFQTTIPAGALGNNGFLRYTLMLGSPDASIANHIYKVYLGGNDTKNPPTGSTAISTNQVQAELQDIIQQVFVLQNSSSTLLGGSGVASNSFTGFATAPVTKTIGTQTNLLFTVTFQGGFSTNVGRLDGLVLEAVQMP